MKKSHKKKSKKKWLITSLVLILLLVVGVGGYTLYEFKFKSYDVADEKVDDIVEDNYIIKLPDGTEITLDSKGDIVNESSGQVAMNDEDIKTSVDTTTGKMDEPTNNNEGTAAVGNNASSGTKGTSTSGNSENGISTNNSVGQKPTVKSIKDKYRSSLEALQIQASTRINGLIGNAKSEYAQKRATGESISVGYFYNKYMGAADSLEASTDAAFNSLITIIENDLSQNGYDKSHAQSFRDEYNASKEALRSNLISEVKSAL
ncbi:hypothetical protein [Ureibacillus sp. GCM10028918]|uniref:hypothetical protein n=1 Tax=Ureibacillus sp. GCM10028918 TaxID=3273429 RepID=UPI0036144A49